MKKISFILTVLFSLSIIFTSCTKDEVKPEEGSIVPENFRVEIPDALIAESTSLKSTNADGLNGNAIYEHLRTFIKVGKNDVIYSCHILSFSQ